MRILVAGIGNIFLGDDAFGVEVVSLLSQRTLPSQVCLRDFGIRSYDLAYAIMDEFDAVILIDAAPLGQPAGTLQVIKPDLAAVAQLGDGTVDAHSMNPVGVLQLVQSLGGRSGEVYVVACQPAVLETEDIGLSEEVRAALPQAAQLVEKLVGDLLGTGKKADLLQAERR